MKEKISRLAKGRFDDKDLQIEIAPSRIELEAVKGSSCRGSFEVRSRSHVQIRAMVFSSARWMRCLTPSFTGEEGSISYELDASSFEAGDIMEGVFTLISNGGERTVPFSVRVIPPFCETSIGSIGDLDQFAALARKDWEEALRLFVKDEFPDIFLHSRKNRQLYRILMQGSDPALAMEEFLCGAYRKDPVKIQVSETEIEYMDPRSEISGKLVIEKSDWGHIRIDVSAIGEFITLDRTSLDERDFLGSFAQLEYRIHPDAAGRQNEGMICLETFDQTLQIPVRIWSSSYREERDRRRKGLAFNLCSLIRLLISHETGHISRGSFQEQAREYIDGCLNNSTDPFFRIMEADYLTGSGRREEAGEILDGFNERELRYQSEVNYIYYLYTNARFREDEHYTEYVKDTIRYYAQGSLRDSWQAAVLLARLQRSYGSRGAKVFARLEAIAQQGNASALLYLEAVRLANMDPSLIRDTGSFSRSLFIWGVRHDALSRECLMQYAALTIRMREFHRQYMLSMMEACRVYESKDMLQALVHLLILGNCSDPQYNKWYRLGVDSALRTPGMYENYMASLDLDSNPELPFAALIYFQYDNRLPDNQKAYLYRYAAENREKHEGLFAGYDGIIRAFVLRKLGEGALSPDLAVLYQIYLKDEALTPRVYRQLPAVMYRQRIRIDDPDKKIAAVIIDYEELKEPLVCIPDEEGVAYADIFLDDYRVAFEDKQGGRRLGRVHYTMEKLLDAGKYARRCYEENPDDPFLIMARGERALKYQMMDEASVRVYKKAASLGQASDSFRRSMLKALIDYCYDTYEGETLEKYLLQADLDLLGPAERGNIIEYFIQRGLFERAYDAAFKYGYDNIRLKRVMRLCSRIIRHKNFEKDDFLTEMAAYTFTKGRYDEAILTCLNRYYNGPAQQLYDIWQAARDFEVSSTQLQERFLCESLFADTMQHEAAEVFESYYESRPDIRITKAFLAVYCRRYLSGEEEARPGLMGILEIELDQMDDARDLCELALIKYAAENSEASRELVLDVRERVAGFLDRGIAMPFFAEYAGSGPIPAALARMSFAMCKARSGSKVQLYFEEDELPPARMQEAAGGIFVRGFRLPPGENLSYRIVETFDGADKEIAAGRLQAPQSVGYGLDDIGRMMAYADEEDEQSLAKELDAYDRFDDMAEKVLHLK